MSSEYAEILARLREVQDKGKPSSAVDPTAKSLAAAADITSKTLSERIGPLEQFRYEQAGSREQRSDTRLSIQQVLTIVGIVAGAVYFLASGAGG